MNIKEAKTQIKNSVKAYLQKDEFGEYIIPTVRQRPIFLIGAPGIGKTAIMEQISKELNICLVSYSMTHHTRQSALGLPFIIHKKYDDIEYDISEYTMSEIIASMYEQMEKTGIREGLLFLDEINCISETLSPAMLQFLQYKTFGRHAVPKGWVVVTAGNTPEFNNSVREFDVVTLDRLKKIEVVPDYNVWKEYAYKVGIHNSIITYLDIKKDRLFNIENTIGGENIATPRGWEDLSEIIYIYEKTGLTIDDNLVVQYIQNKNIAKDFAVYYNLYNNYKVDYNIDKILNAEAEDELIEKAKNAGFEERIGLISILLEVTAKEAKCSMACESIIQNIYKILSDIKSKYIEGQHEIMVLLNGHIAQVNSEIEKLNVLINYDIEKKRQLYRVKNELITYKNILYENNCKDEKETFALIKDLFEKKVNDMKNRIQVTKNHLNNMIDYVKEIYGHSHELLMLITEITMNHYTSSFINKFGCEKYFENNKDILLYKRNKEIMEKVEKLDI